jgi:FkbM family methyltransferase
MEDLVRGGDEVLDVGANIGALTAFLWKLVGSKGRVHSFEANPQLMARLLRNLTHHNLPTGFLQNAAVWSESGCSLMLEIDQSYYHSSSRVRSSPQDSIYSNAPIVHVSSLSLDDYCKNTGTAPAFIKVDVEGAEEQVLKGASNVLDSYKPSLIIEYNRANPAPAFLLADHGYTLFDVHSYEKFDPLHSDRIDLLTNILAVHRSNAVVMDSQWKYDPTIVEKRNIPCRILPQAAKPNTISTDYFELQPGRWMISAEINLTGSGNACLSVADEQRRNHYACEAPHPYISSYVCHNAILKTSKPGRFQCSLEAKSPGLLINGGGIRLSEITFDNSF